jgi:hypothetical protein
LGRERDFVGGEGGAGGDAQRLMREGREGVALSGDGAQGAQPLAITLCR